MEFNCIIRDKKVIKDYKSFTVKDIKDIIRAYNKKVKIAGYSKLKKDKLIDKIKDIDLSSYIK